MKPLSLLPYYFAWHYSRGLRSSLKIIENLLWFVGHLFSIPLLLRTLFSPWQRMQEERPPGLSFENIIGTFALNIVLRFAGGVIRLMIVGAGLFFMAVILAGGALFIALWLAFPVCVLFFFILGIALLFK